MAGKGALNWLVKKFEGYSLPRDKVTSLASKIMSSRVLPDEQLLYHGGADPMYDLHNISRNDSKGLYTSSGLGLPRLFSQDGGYITPLVIPKDQLGPRNVENALGVPLDPHDDPEYWVRFQRTLIPLLNRLAGKHYAGGGPT